MQVKDLTQTLAGKSQARACRRFTGTQRDRLTAGLLLVALLCGSAATSAELSPRPRAEIDHLLAYLAQSGCRFERNGTWYDADKGRAHMERKLGWLLRRDLVASAEEFIGRAASHSSRTGEAYRVQCGDAEPVTSAAWFNAELRRLRAQRSSNNTSAR